MTPRRRVLIGVAGAAPLLLAGCARTAPSPPPLPRFAYRSPSILAAYEFAMGAGAEVLRQLPCYCACAALGHGHLRDCFIRDNGAFDSHASGCEVCVDEALDAQRLLAQ